jgi:hypothetical protein
MITTIRSSSGHDPDVDISQDPVSSGPADTATRPTSPDTTDMTAADTTTTAVARTSTG